MPEFWILAIASLVATSCAIIGVFLVLRKLSMLGDAISHSVLFGIVVGFLLTGTRSSVVMLLGAAASGLLTAYATSVLNRHGRLQEDASIGVTFTFLFALGVILISLFASQVDLDQDCVLYGEIAFAPFDRVVIGSTNFGPRSFWILLGVTLVDILFLTIGFRKLKAMSFDPLLAASLGINVTLWHYLLMTFVSLTTVASFESVGAILVVALLVIPVNTAYIFARSVLSLTLWSVFFGILSVFGGIEIAERYDASISAAIGTCAGVLFFIVLLFLGESSPVSKLIRRTLSSLLQRTAAP